MQIEELGSGLVTGASSGIGAVYADRLAARGHGLILVARDRARLEAVAAKLRTDHDATVDVLKADLGNESDLARVEQRLRDDPSITVLVNNAGIATAGPFASADPDALERVIRVNVVAPTRLAQTAAAAFAARRSGTIINIGSTVALMPEMRIAVYGATKAYVQYLGEALSHELEGSGVRVQVVLPGLTRTEFLDRAGVGTAHIAPSQLMEPGDLVDAALAGLDLGERVTLPSLPDTADWQAHEAARLKLAPNLSRDKPAARYAVPSGQA